MNLTGGTSFSGELRFELENHFPEAHYKKAIDKAFRQRAEENLRADGGREWYETVEEYWQAFEDFDERHPPRYVNPGRPVDHDTVDYFPHRHFQQNIQDFAESEEEYRNLLDVEVLRKYDIEPALE